MEPKTNSGGFIQILLSLLVSGWNELFIYHSSFACELLQLDKTSGASEQDA